MNKNKIANQICADNLLNDYFYSKFLNSSHLHSLELIISPKCNLCCSYCYLQKHKSELFCNNTTNVINNLKLVLNWLAKNQFKPSLELFSGELFAQSLGYEVLETILAYEQQLPSDYRIPQIIIASNFTFLCSDELTNKVNNLRNEFEKIGIAMHLSASVDGKYVEQNRAYEHNIDIPIDIIRDDTYYDKLFDYCKKYKIRLHPMIYSECIEQWPDNFLWLKSQLLKRDQYPYDFYLLEVRDENWTIEQIHKFQLLLKMIYKELWEYSNHDKQQFIELLLNPNFNCNIAGHILWPHSGLTCSLQSSLSIRLDDLSVPPCHRTAYSEFMWGQYKPNSNNELQFQVEHLELMATTLAVSTDNLPYCTNCPINHICIGQCLGAMYESNKNLFVPIPSVCALEHAKAMALIESLVEFNVFSDVLRHLSTPIANQLNNLRRLYIC